PSQNPSTYQRICKGNLNYKKAVAGMNIEDKVRTLLGLAKMHLLGGYYGASGAHHTLDEPQFESLETKDYDPRRVSNVR
ncbi:MAG: hypothetical protein L6408_07460, partial [Nanoarchaeota archaeon]|nr:hypothetical protein [Nanoarchaeota archaeon]